MNRDEIIIAIRKISLCSPEWAERRLKLLEEAAYNRGYQAGWDSHCPKHRGATY